MAKTHASRGRAHGVDAAAIRPPLCAFGFTEKQRTVFASMRRVGHVQPMSPAPGYGGLTISLLRPLGGPNARVFLANASSDAGFTKLVAVKKHPAGLEIEAVRERARLLGGLAQSQILRIEDSAPLDDGIGVVLEYVDGLNLIHLLDTPPGLAPRSTLQVIAEVTCALAAAWERVPLGVRRPLRLAHGRLDFDQIMLSKDGALKVLGYGLDNTPVAEDDDLAHLNDIYTLGLLGIEMLGGRLPSTLPESDAEHDKVIERLVYGIEDVGMPNPEWEEALRETLCQMATSDPQLRPCAAELQPVLLQFADHASGESLATLAVRVVQPAIASLEDTEQPLESTASSAAPIPLLDAYDDDAPTNPGDSQVFAKAHASLSSEGGLEVPLPNVEEDVPAPSSDAEDRALDELLPAADLDETLPGTNALDAFSPMPEAELDDLLPVVPEPTDARPLPMRERAADDASATPIAGNWNPEESGPFDRQGTAWEEPLDEPDGESPELEVLPTYDEPAPVGENAWRQPTTAQPPAEVYALDEPVPFGEQAQPDVGSSDEDDRTPQAPPAPAPIQPLAPASPEPAPPPMPRIEAPATGAPTIARPSPPNSSSAPTIARPSPGSEQPTAQLPTQAARPQLPPQADTPKSKAKTATLFLGAMILVAGAGAWLAMPTKAPESEPVAPDALDTRSAADQATFDDVATAEPTGTQIRLTAADGLVQWFRVTEADSGEQHKGRGELEVHLPAGSHALAIKRIGQSIIEAEFTVGEADAEYRCAKNADEIFECVPDGGDQPPIAFATE